MTDLAELEAHMDAVDEARRARLRRPDALHSAARWYVQHGIAVFPLLPGTKVPATKHGFKNYSLDLCDVETWWAAEPLFNIGLPTGLRFDVLDIDPPNGWASLERIKANAPPMPVLGRVVTARTGLHLYLPPSGRGNHAGMLPGVDYRGLGGYVVAPPSRTEVGTWEWTSPLRLEADCEVCGLEMTLYQEDQRTHPGCGPA